MTEETIFLDSSVFLAFFIDGKDVFGRLSDRKLVTSTNVIEEVVYVLIKEVAREKTNMEKHYELLAVLRKKYNLVIEISGEIISDVMSVLDSNDIMVLPPASFTEMFAIIETYGLLPNDALIASTCKHHGIKKIATFDEDFKRVNFLEVITP